MNAQEQPHPVNGYSEGIEINETIYIICLTKATKKEIDSATLVEVTR
jgi:hypothetical protein